MKLPDIKLTYPGKPCGNLRIRSIEKHIGRKLPSDYKKFIMQTGGGTLSLKNTHLTGIPLHNGETLDINVDTIFGHGHTPDDDNNLVGFATFLTEEWEIPPEVLLIADSDNGMHECFVLNYDLKDFPKHCVLYLDNDYPNQYTLIAPTFTEFLAMLQPSPDYDEEAEKYSGQQGLLDARTGPLGETLTKAIAASPYDDMESILRRAAEDLAIKHRLEMYGGEKSFRFQDLLFYLAQPFGPHYSLETWKAPRHNRDDSVNKADLVLDSFRDERGFSSLCSNESGTCMWWEDRVNSGILVETEQGYRLKEDYMTELIDSFR